MEVNDVTALEASTAAISAQIAAIERKMVEVIALLNGLRLQLDLFTENRMADIRKYLTHVRAYFRQCKSKLIPSSQRDCTKPHQIGDLTELCYWRDNNPNWNPNACRHFQDAWSAQGINPSAQACELASIAIKQAMNKLECLKRTSTPFDDVLTGRVRHEVLLKRKASIQKEIQLILKRELRKAKRYFTNHATWQHDVKKSAGNARLVNDFESEDAATRRDMLDMLWEGVFEFIPGTPAAQKRLYIIWVFLQVPFMHELPKLAQELDKGIAALREEVPEELLQ